VASVAVRRRLTAENAAAERKTDRLVSEAFEFTPDRDSTLDR
jgi:hypothetical protein